MFACAGARCGQGSVERELLFKRQVPKLALSQPASPDFVTHIVTTVCIKSCDVSPPFACFSVPIGTEDIQDRVQGTHAS